MADLQFPSIPDAKVWARDLPLAQVLCLTEAGETYARVEVRGRRLPRKGEVGLWVHTVPSWNECWDAEQFLGCEGEVCFSQLGDDLLNSGTCIVMHGPAVAVYGCDVWSKVDMLGRRYTTGRVGNTGRTEAWVRPADCDIAFVVSQDPRVIACCGSLGIPVKREAGRKYSSRVPREWRTAAAWGADGW